MLKESVDEAPLFASTTSEELSGISENSQNVRGRNTLGPGWLFIGILRRLKSGSLSAMEPDFPRNRFLAGIQKTIRIYSFIWYYELHRVVQQELGNVEGEDLCVH